MSSIDLRRTDALQPGSDESRWISPNDARSRERPLSKEPPREQVAPERWQLAARRDALAAAEAAANSAGLGASAEEITFGASERAELEAHDETRDSQERRVERVEGVMRVAAIQEMLRQLSGEQRFASIRQRADRFALQWAAGNTSQALEDLNVDAFNAVERQALFQLAHLRTEGGPGAEQLRALMSRAGEEETTFHVADKDTLDGLMQATGSHDKGRRGSEAFSRESPVLQALQSPPTPKLVLDAAAGLGPDGLDRLARLAVPRGRVDARTSRGAEVFLSLSLLRIVQQLRQVERSGVALMKAGDSPGVGKPEEVQKTTRWLLETTFASPNQVSLHRMATVLKINGDALARARRQMQHGVHELPAAVWLGGDTKKAVIDELRNANTADLERRGLLTRWGLVSPRG
ncbi:hypothetical protein [Mitsuaria sp. GD03876]|uniref:hypothetical protein n=1 Tax=Mitsuaria sp. GD03876 TaxID=2975399 RepID=UPI002446F4A5|nr:hypothetical protein [Mitsuaria sp. GD03876]MDH0865335.1 hypothetical protein [Mitsuaria sp. GD03876]